ncbi:hypothetical protein ACVOMV_20410 [Mesorhizobium atlanticum]
MYQFGHTVTDAPKLPLNLLDALREFDNDKSLKAALGEEFSSGISKAEAAGMEFLCFALHAVGARPHAGYLESSVADERPRNDAMKYSIFSLARAALSGHKNWKPTWRDAAPKDRYDGGDHRRRRTRARRQPRTSPASSASATSRCSKKAGSAPATPAATPPSSAPITACSAIPASTSCR